MNGTSSATEKGLHNHFIKKKLHSRIRHFSSANISALDRARTPGGLAENAMPDWFEKATSEQRQSVRDSQTLSRTSNQTLAQTLTGLKGVTEFAQPLLEAALRKRFGLTVDVTQTWFYQRILSDDLATNQTLLELALRNFADGQPFDDEDVIAERGALVPYLEVGKGPYGWNRPQKGPSTRYRIKKLSIKPADFAALCRELDIGKRYQNHLTAMFEAADRVSTVRDQTIQAWKDSLRVHAHIAHLKSLITSSAYNTLLAVLNGDASPTLDGERVTCSQLHVLGSPVSELFVIGASRRKNKKIDLSWTNPGVNLIDVLTYEDSRIIVCIPGDPLAPVMEYASLKAFENDLCYRLRDAAYQRAFLRLIPHGDAGKFLSKISTALQTLKWSPDFPLRQETLLGHSNGIYQHAYRDEPALDISEAFFDTQPFGELYTRHQTRLKDTAEQLAVPTVKVDHDAWHARMVHYAEWGLDILNVGAFFVPGLGEVMMAVMAVQLTTDVYHGVEAWSIGDTDQAWNYLGSVAANLAFMAAMGAVASKAPKVLSNPFVDGLVNIKLPFGDEQLWRPSLAPYKSDVVLPEGLRPNTSGQYELNGKTYIKLDGDPYEKIFDPALGKWRLKHPKNPHAYHPVLEHNGQGAWRHRFERPLEWGRAMMLRRLGHATDGLDVATLDKIAELSGIDDNALRKVHTDNRAMPSVLSDVLAQFQADRQVTELIERVRLGESVPDTLVNISLPHVVNMPRWPQGRVIEIFDQANPGRASLTYGKASIPTRPAIRISNADVSLGKLPHRVLSSLDESEITALLGGEGARVEAEREAVFRQQLADHLSANKTSMFDSIEKGANATKLQTAELKALQRSFPDLSNDAVQELLSRATTRERLHLKQTARLPGSLLLKARARARLARLNKAMAGLSLESMASADSQRLALHALQNLPGWPKNLRIELRQGDCGGTLLDSIGSPSATQVKYLVKDGYQHRKANQFQAFDQQENALNSVPELGDNFFSSIMHALPDATREGLGLPHVGQSVALQETLTAYATQHRQKMLETLVPNAARQRFKWPQRLADARFGYPLSGRGAGASVNQSLVGRVRDVYPRFSDEQASQMIERLILDGRTESQIAHLLNLRAREYEGLCTTLDRWLETAQGEPRNLQNAAQSIKEAWQARGIVDGEASTIILLNGVDSLPALAADFSHVRRVCMDTDLLLTQTPEAISQAFPNVAMLDLTYTESNDLARVAEVLAGLPQVRELAIYGYGPLFADGAQQMIGAMPQLERLYVLGKVHGMDVSAMTGLRSLTLAGDMGWPQGVLDLPDLEALSIEQTSITTLPEELFTGHENIWRALKLNWMALEPEQFMRAFEHVSSHLAHVFDVDAMVHGYCRKTLQRILSEDSVFSASVMRELLAEGMSNRMLVQRFTQLNLEETSLERQLSRWHQSFATGDRFNASVLNAQRICSDIRSCWLAGLRKRYGGETAQVAQPSTSWGAPQAQSLRAAFLDLAGSPLGSLPELPALPTTGFTHVQVLGLSDLRVSAEDLSGFVQHFPEVRSVDLSGNQLSTIPQGLSSLGRLTELNLARNQLSVTAAVQADLNRLAALQQLNLQLNRVESLDVTAMTHLHTLRLGRTGIKEWPNGALDLPGLRKLDLSRTAITTIPEQALTEGFSTVVDVSGCALTPRARTDLLASTSAPKVMGIERTVLLEGRTGGEPEYFPEFVSHNPALLLEVPSITAQELQQIAPVARLMRLDAQLLESEATQRIEALSSKGMNAEDVDGQIADWEQQHQNLVQSLNAWIEQPPYQVGDLRTLTWVSALERRRAADQLLTCWRQNLRGAAAGEHPAGAYTLDFSSMPLGSFPPLAGDFAHVGTLKSNRVYLSEQGLQGLVDAFSHIHTLEIDSNGLLNLPEAVTSFRQLKRLSAARNEMINTLDLQARVSALTTLESLNLASNALEGLNVTALRNLRELDLHENNLVVWPEGALQLPLLRTLNLSENMIEALPEGLLSDVPSELVRGINLTDNSLDDDELNEIGSYLERTGHGLGYTTESLDQALRTYEHEFGEGESTSDGSEYDTSDEEVVVDTTGDVAREQWIDSTSSTADELSGIWSNFKQEPASPAFFKMLHKLLGTPEYKLQPGKLRLRVADVLRAAQEDETLRGVLFEMANVSDTCPDGYALVFSDIEVKVYECGILKAAPVQDQANVLFRLGRAQFRLDTIESIAADFIKLRKRLKLHYDEAEVQLAYRIGLADRLDLPGQFRNMRYEQSSHVTREMLDEAYAKVIAAEQSQDLIVALVQRTYWADLLKSENPERFIELEQERSQRLEVLEGQYPQFNEAYKSALVMLDIEMKQKEMQVLIELSGPKIATLTP
ncbi:NEL-type E3 ubiquitin ligase domain-containing protein [Pseudomonas sp. PDM31]|uniref:NEL-type E3 ubiquitin ligase domain-containing protein n=1 Tax=Pseudomonas sp. PDM31 TaxID=2854778 RepID=UPI001C475B65|nr:NEL-type E3 ubiquitin ligase domain-containing protein [Pseudomonas sp. PDM31]MBV7476338.1 hypothetical protein [Pseudomonas sp. PDM31]